MQACCLAVHSHGSLDKPVLLARRHLPASLLITRAVIQVKDETHTDSPVVTLGSHAGVGEAQDGSKAVAAQVALPSTPLSACCCCLLQRLLFPDQCCIRKLMTGDKTGCICSHLLPSLVGAIPLHMFCLSAYEHYYVLPFTLLYLTQV